MLGGSGWFMWFKAVFQSQLEPSLLFFFVVEFNVALLWCHVTHENEV